MTHEPGDMLLFALSAWKETSWAKFKKLFDEIYRIRLMAEEIGDPAPVHYERSRALRALVTLGHCDVDITGSFAVTIGSPTLAALPSTGLPRAVLCGSRSPKTVRNLQQICRESRQSLRLIQDSQQRREPYAPLRVELEAESNAAPTAIGFKGPGTKGMLTPGKMGHNGDQIQRLFDSDAQVFLVQYEGPIAESVPQQLRALAVNKSLQDQRRVFYGIIALEDSYRIRIKYRKDFQKAALKAAKKAK